MSLLIVGTKTRTRLEDFILSSFMYHLIMLPLSMHKSRRIRSDVRMRLLRLLLLLVRCMWATLVFMLQMPMLSSMLALE